MTNNPHAWRLTDLETVPQNGIKVMSTFACGGGSSMGYKRAGGEVVAAPRAGGGGQGRGSASNGSRATPRADMRVEGRGSALHPLRGLLQAIADRCSDEGAATFARWLGKWARVLALYGRPGRVRVETGPA